MADHPAGWRIKAATDNLVFLVGYGTWSTSVARGFCSEYRELVESFAGRSWAVLGDATDWELKDEDVQDLIRDQNRWIVSHGCRAGCFYTGPGALERLLLYRLAEPDTEDYRFRVYPDRRRSVEALAEAGYPVSDNQLERFFRGEGGRD